jgi:hypothetical protein
LSAATPQRLASAGGVVVSGVAGFAPFIALALVCSRKLVFASLQNTVNELNQFGAGIDLTLESAARKKKTAELRLCGLQDVFGFSVRASTGAELF